MGGGGDGQWLSLAEALFAQADLDGDGRLCREEFQAAACICSPCLGAALRLGEPILMAEIYLRHACSCQEILRTETAGQARRRGPPPPPPPPPRRPKHQPA